MDPTRAVAAAKMWQKRKYDAGWACIRWDKEFGGRGANAIQQVIWNQEEAKYKVPAGFFVIGQGMAAPTLMTWGKPEHHERYLPMPANLCLIAWYEAIDRPKA